MKDLYSNLGFRENPFSRYSAEEERAYLTDIFVKPRYYSTTYTDIKSGLSRFIFGERGIGKTALVLSLKQDLQNDSNFTILIDEYEGIPIKNDGRQLLYVAIQKLVTEFSIVLLNNKSLLKSLVKEDTEKLSIFVNSFFITLSRKQFFELYDKTSKRSRQNFLRKAFNAVFLKPVNTVLSGLTEFLGSTISQALGLPARAESYIYREYISELKDIPAENKIKFESLDYKTLKTILFEIANLVKKCGFSGVTIIYDKIDEYRVLGTQLSNIATFSKTLVLDTALLLDGKISFVFSFWSRIRPYLSDLGVRYDKLKPVDITWNDRDLSKIINERLSYFSDKKVISITNIIPEKHLKSIFELSKQSPRHLIMLLSKIFDEQATLDEGSMSISDEAIERGQENFATTFDFYTYYSGTKPDTMRKIIQELVKVHKVEFETSDLIGAFRISSQTANNRIRTMLDYGLIDDITTGTRAKKYKIIEPRVAYIISKNLPY